MRDIEEVLGGDIRTMGIAGHIRPDGDAVCSCVALYLYVKKHHPEIHVEVYLDHPRPVFGFLPGIEEVRMEEEDPERVFDLFVTCDVAAEDRLSLGAKMFSLARHTVCIDHHRSNAGFAEVNHVRGEIGSCAEVLYGLMAREKIDRDIAIALYAGIIHDTGVLQQSNTTPETLRIAGELLSYGFDHVKIIEDSFYSRTYIQNQVMGRVLTESLLIMDGKVIIGYLKKNDMDFYGVTGQDLEGIVAQMLRTSGTLVSMFLYETATQAFKVSLRSREPVDVAKIASFFGGGGHARAAGCNLSGSMYDVINNVTDQIQLQLCQEEAS